MRSLRFGSRPVSYLHAGFLIEPFVLIAVFSLPFSKSIAEAAVWTALALWIFKKAVRREKLLSLGISNAAYAAFLALTFLSLLQVPSELMITALRGCFKWLKFIGIFFMCAETFDHPQKRKRLAGIFIASMILTSLNGYYQLWSGIDFVKGYSVHVPGRFVRMQSSFSSPNGLAAFLLMGLPLIFFLWYRTGTWKLKSAFYVIIMALFSTAFVMTLSRSAFLAFLVSLSVYVFFRKEKRLVLLIWIVPIVIFLTSDTLRYNFLTSLNLGDITVGERLRFWRTTWAMISEHPFLGHGVNTYYQNFPLFAPAEETYRGYAHNCFLQMWSEVGFFGLLAFLIPLFSKLKSQLWNRPKEARLDVQEAVLVGLVAFLVQSFFDTHFYSLQTAFLFWIFWGALHSPAGNVQALSQK